MIPRLRKVAAIISGLFRSSASGQGTAHANESAITDTISARPLQWRVRGLSPFAPKLHSTELPASEEIWICKVPREQIFPEHRYRPMRTRTCHLRVSLFLHNLQKRSTESKRNERIFFPSLHIHASTKRGRKVSRFFPRDIYTWQVA